VLAPLSNTRACFFTYIGTNAVAGFAGQNDRARIYNDNTNWLLGGDGIAEAEASCVDVSALVSATVVDPQPSNVSFAVNSGPPNQCLLTTIGGAMRVNDYNNGSFVDFDPSHDNWILSVSARKSGQVLCIQ